MSDGDERKAAAAEAEAELVRQWAAEVAAPVVVGPLSEETALRLLIDDDEAWYTEPAERAFREIFARFDADGDGAWREEELQAFALAVNGQKFSDSEVTDLRAAVNHNEAGHLTETGFLEFYTLHCGAHPVETWSDLAKLGYSRDFELNTAGGKEAGEAKKE